MQKGSYRNENYHFRSDGGRTWREPQGEAPAWVPESGAGGPEAYGGVRELRRVGPAGLAGVDGLVAGPAGAEGDAAPGADGLEGWAVPGVAEVGWPGEEGLVEVSSWWVDAGGVGAGASEGWGVPSAGSAEGRAEAVADGPSWPTGWARGVDEGWSGGEALRDDAPPSLFHVHLAFGGDGGGTGRGGIGDGGAEGGCCPDAPRGADVLAVVSDGRIAIEEVRARPPLPLDDLAALAARIEGPLNDAFRGLVDRHGTADALCRNGVGPAQEPPGARRGRPSARRGSAVRNVAAEAYRGALADGEDPVLAVMRATGRSRRKSLRLIAGARDAGLLMSGHHRR